MKKALIIGVIVALAGMFGVAAHPAMAVTCPEGTVQAGSDVGSLAECMLEGEDHPQDAMSVANRIINVVMGVLGVVAVGVMILGGFYYITSQGDAPKIQRAKNTILYGLVGFVIVLLSYAIVNFVLSKVFA